MPSVFRDVCSVNLSSTFSSHKNPARGTVRRRIFALIVIVIASLAQGQPTASAPSPGPQRILVKLKAALAQEVEAEFPANIPAQQMHIPLGQAGSAHVQDFIRRHSARQISPVYPEIVRIKKQHGWSDAQFAEHIRSRFAKRTHRHTPVPVPELSRTYVLEFGVVSSDEKAL